MKTIKFVLMALLISCLLHSCTLFSKGTSGNNSGKKENPVSGGKK